MRSPGFHDRGSIHGRYVAPVLFTLSILVSAGLLFFIQPLITQIVTPLVGGAPGVWTTAVFFFQIVTIGGVLYAHLVTRLSRVRHQCGVHFFVWLVAVTTLPLDIPENWAPDGISAIQTQIFWLFAGSIGLPFFFLSANAALIQTWYGRTRGPSAADPYFLFGAANVGSLIALFGFPMIAAPFFGISTIATGWDVGFLILGGLLFSSVLATIRDHPDAKTVLPIVNRKSDLRAVFTWGMIAFVPSSLMLALTTKITTDLGSHPLLWAIPLALYLLTYFLGFMNRSFISPRIMSIAYPSAIVALAVFGSNTLYGRTDLLSAGVLAVAFFIIGLQLHKALYNLRPDPTRLTIFFLTLSIGSAAGGLFNAIIAPSLMSGMHELPLTLLAAAAVIALYTKAKTVNSGWPAIFVIAAVMLGLVFEGSTDIITTGMLIAFLILAGGMMAFGTMYRLGLGLLTLCIALMIVHGEAGDDDRPRDFFGMHSTIDGGHS